MGKQVITSFVRSSDQLGDILTKALNKGLFYDLCNKMGIRLQLEGECWNISENGT